ncbi:hypothetical protein HYDPIDRAFT_23085 [Hydnomerulius pinastri MD-312]|nr:hypothetical protein HYDPIDRAFT_23085 [Hydnomerulius pinastri MD-312]
MSTTASLRKRPHCHKCGSLMQGHRRKHGTLICPDQQSLFSETAKSHSTPLPSPPASTGGSPPATPTPESTPERARGGFKPPPGDHWHWRNPNWVSPPCKTRLHSPSDLDRGSLAPTEPLTEYQASHKGSYYPVPRTLHEQEEEVPVEDGSWADDLNNEEDYDSQNSEQYEYFPYPSNSLSPRPWNSFSQSPVTDISLNTALRASTPLFKVFRTPREDLPEVTRIAQREGKHVGIMNTPPAHLATAKIPREKADGTVWVLVSDREEDLQYAIDSQQRGMPGTLFPEEQHRGMGFLQVALAGIMGGLMVTCGLAFL